jgi:hypothetical protein
VLDGVNAASKRVLATMRLSTPSTHLYVKETPVGASRMG